MKMTFVGIGQIEALRLRVNLRPLQAGFANGWSVDEWRDLLQQG